MEKNEKEKIIDLIKKEKVELKVKRSGMIQRILFEIKKVDEPYGSYPVLHTDRAIDLSELARLADEINLPVRAPNGIVFPRGKTGKDFVGLI